MKTEKSVFDRCAPQSTCGTVRERMCLCMYATDPLKPRLERDIRFRDFGSSHGSSGTSVSAAFLFSVGFCCPAPAMAGGRYGFTLPLPFARSILYLRQTTKAWTCRRSPSPSFDLSGSGEGLFPFLGPFFPLPGSGSGQRRHRSRLNLAATVRLSAPCLSSCQVSGLHPLLLCRAAGSASDHRHSLTRVPRTAFRSPLPVFFSSQRGSCPGPGLPCICCSVTAPASAVDLPMYSSVAAVSAPAAVLLPACLSPFGNNGRSLRPVRRRPGPASPRLPPAWSRVRFRSVRRPRPPCRAPPPRPLRTTRRLQCPWSWILPMAVSFLRKRKRSGRWRLRRLLHLRLPHGPT